jgi:hypothetical protein
MDLMGRFTFLTLRAVRELYKNSFSKGIRNLSERRNSSTEPKGRPMFTTCATVLHLLGMDHTRLPVTITESSIA